MKFSQKLSLAQELTSSILCVGLDPDPAKLPAPLRSLPVNEAVRLFCQSIIRATKAVACAYKPNLAFFESLGPEGGSVLADVIAAIPPDRIILADGKRSDIGNTARKYADAVFAQLGCDACTVSPYMGRDAVAPFIAQPGKAAFVLVRTSNPSAREFQHMMVGGVPLYQKTAAMASDWGRDAAGEIGFVVGATNPNELAQLREAYPDIPFLIPGVGAQGGNPSEVVAASKPDQSPVLVNASRSILYAGAGVDYADRAFEAASKLREALRA